MQINSPKEDKPADVTSRTASAVQLPSRDRKSASLKAMAILATLAGSPAACGGNVTIDSDCAACASCDAGSDCLDCEQPITVDFEEDMSGSENPAYPYGFGMTNLGEDPVNLVALHYNVVTDPVLQSVVFSFQADCSDLQDVYTVVSCNDYNLIPQVKKDFRFNAVGPWSEMRVIGAYFNTPDGGGAEPVFTDLANEQIVFFNYQEY